MLYHLGATPIANGSKNRNEEEQMLQIGKVREFGGSVV
jgi:hypothetical protein